MSIRLTNTPVKPPAHKLWPVRVWFLATWLFAYPLGLLARLAHRRMGADPLRFAERLGNSGKKADQPVIWFHAASLGEMAQIAPLVRHFLVAGDRVLVTSFTQAGASWVSQEMPEVVHQFVPLDTGSAVRRFLDTWDIRAAIFFEGDFAPRLTLAAQARGIPMALVNARHSTTRERFPAVFGALLAGFALITCRSESVARGISALGVPEDRISILPDLRIAADKLPCPADLRASLLQQVGTRPVWLAASTHQSDEAAVLDAHRFVLDAMPNCLLVIAPRHPKRGTPLAHAAEHRNYSAVQRSSGTQLGPDTQIYIADTLGELGVFMSFASVTFLGGSFGNEGGHNPYEPARFGTAVLSGPNVKNFAEAFDAMDQSGAAELVQKAELLGPRLVDLMQSDAAQRMGEAGQHFVATCEVGLPETIARLKSALRL